MQRAYATPWRKVWKELGFVRHGKVKSLELFSEGLSWPHWRSLSGLKIQVASLPSVRKCKWPKIFACPRLPCFAHHPGHVQGALMRSSRCLLLWLGVRTFIGTKFLTYTRGLINLSPSVVLGLSSTCNPLLPSIPKDHIYSYSEHSCAATSRITLGLHLYSSFLLSASPHSQFLPELPSVLIKVKCVWNQFLYFSPWNQLPTPLGFNILQSVPN